MEYVIDIETAPWNYEDYKEQFENSKKKPGLHAIISQVACIGIHEIDTNHSSVLSLTEFDSEASILEWFYNLIKARKNDTLVSFNGKAFDLPVLGLRAAKHGIPLKRCLPENRSIRHVDIYDAIGGKWQSDISSCSLSELAWLILGTPKESNGADVAIWFSEGEYEKIDRHCLNDVKITGELYKRLKGVYW